MRIEHQSTPPCAHPSRAGTSAARPKWNLTIIHWRRGALAASDCGARWFQCAPSQRTRRQDGRGEGAAAPSAVCCRVRLAPLALLTFSTFAASLHAAAAGPFPNWKHLSSATGDIPSPDGGNYQTSLLVADLDRDGLNDLVVAERSAAPAVVWLRRNQGGWTRHVVDPDAAPIAAGGAVADIDGDGDSDLVFGSSGQAGHVWWWENPAPRGDPAKAWRRHVITDRQKGQHHDQLAGDFLGRGRPQIVSWYQGGGELSLFPIPDNPRQPAAWNVVTVARGLKQAEGLAAGDIDGDGKPDIVGGGRWFKHLGGGTFASVAIDHTQTAGRTAVGDLKRGGRPEVVMVMGDGVGRLKWYECTGNPMQPTAWRGHDLLGTDVNHGHSLQLADINADGHLDIFCAEMAQWGRGTDNANSKAWIFYGDGKGSFTKTEVATGIDFHEAKIADLNGDGRLDIVSKPFVWQTPRIDVWLNLAP